MKSYRKTSSIVDSLTSGSNIMGATGLPRAALRRIFADSGLFGTQSLLSAPEKAMVYTELQLPAGAVPALPATDEIPNPWRTSAMRSLVRVFLRREMQWYERHVALARWFGIEDRVIAEVVRTVQTAMFLYGAAVQVPQDVTVCNVAPTANANADLLSRVAA